MAGTDKSRASEAGAATPGPAVILVKPQLGENIGFAARAMLNCGLTDMRLVSPRDGWPNEKARIAASGADEVIDGVRLFDRLEDAVVGLGRVYAATARSRDMIMPVMTPRRAAADLRVEIGQGVACGLLFGRERWGLENDEVALADTIVQVPLNPAYSSLSLPQAVLLLAYEWYQAGSDAPPEELVIGHTVPAAKEDLLFFFERLEGMLEDAGFFQVKEKRPGMVRNIRNIFQRKQLTDQELRTLQGILSAFDPARRRGRGG